MVPAFLGDRGIQVQQKGSVAAAEIEKRGVIDEHYASIARVGMARDEGKLRLSPPAADRFAEGYGVRFEDALSAGQVHSAATAMEALGASPSELLERCLASGYEKLGSGLYAAQLETSAGQPLYVLNGFYARMREKYVAPGAVVHWFVVTFKAEDLPWQAFRRAVIGATNPIDAAEGSLRAKFRDEWQSLGLQAETSNQDNGVHASAGPVEALRERLIWAGARIDDDPFGAALISRGFERTATDWLDNAEVELGDGRRGRVFDLLEDIDTQEALEVLANSKRIAEHL